MSVYLPIKFRIIISYEHASHIRQRTRPHVVGTSNLTNMFDPHPELSHSLNIHKSQRLSF